MNLTNQPTHAQHQSDYKNDGSSDLLQQESFEADILHVGHYENEKQSMKKAGQHLIKSMLRKLPKIKKSHKILIIGSGYGEAARFLVEKYGCNVDHLNPNEMENERSRVINKAAELDHKLSVITGDYNDIPQPRNNYYFVWSQDALSRSIDKAKVFREVSRVLLPEGRFILTDLLQTSDCPEKVLRKIYDYSDIEELGTAKLYRRLARTADLERVYYKEFPQQLVTHYNKGLNALKKNKEAWSVKYSKSALQKKMKGLKHIAEAGYQGYLTWALLQFQKRNV